MSGRYVVVVPVKRPEVGKSRLVGLPDAARGQLAAAFATDTVSACVEADDVAQVLVTTDDAGFADVATRLGATTCPDGDSVGLNAALRHAAGVARQTWPGLRPVAVLADLPALRPEALGDALARLPEDAAYVADSEGTGTTLYSATYDAFDPRYGAGSAAAHAAAGALQVPDAAAGLRRDVDDIATLRAATALGVGTATAALLSGLADLLESAG